MLKTINLKNLNAADLKEWLANFDTILTDCDAVLWHDNEVINDVPDTINTLQSLGKDIYFVTNNGTITRHDLWLKAKKMNYNLAEEHIIAPTYSIAQYLKQQLQPQEQVYVIGSPALAQELNRVGIENFGIGEDVVNGKWLELTRDVVQATSQANVGALVVGFDEHFSFVKMLKASNIMHTNPQCLFLATNADAVYRYSKFSMPGTGAILQSLVTCLQRKAEIMGKPNPLICENLIKMGAIKPQRTLMIGDCHKTDVVFGKNCGFQTLLVGTGNNNWSKVEELIQAKVNDHIPHYYLDSLGDLLPFLM